MKLNEIINLNKPQIKVEALPKGRIGSGNPRTLLMKDLHIDNLGSEIKEIISKIVSKYVEGKSDIKLIDRKPLTFNVVPENGNDFFRFLISFPPGTDDIQNDLITSIENFGN